MEKVNAVYNRVNKYDNLRGLAIFLVVLVHFDILDTMPVTGLKMILLICLPIFFFIAGFFSKIGPNEPLKSFKRLMIPYILFCILYKLFDLFILGFGNWTNVFIRPGFAMWFLIALFFMKMALPIFDRFKYPILISLICAVIFGFLNVDDNLLGLTRAFSYYPLFLLGFYYNKYRDKLSDSRPKIANFCNNHFKLILVALIIISIVPIITFPEKAFYLKDAYSGNLLKEAIRRFIIILLSMAWALVVLRLMTNKQFFLTKFGINSMAVYLLHGFVRQYFKPIVTDVFAKSKPEFFVVMVIATFVVTFVFSRDIVSKCINTITDGIYNLIVRKETVQ